MGKLKLAIIGLGFGRHHANQIHSNQINLDIELAAVSDLNPDRIVFADLLGLPFYQDYKEMLRSEKLDAVLVAVPPEYHASIGIDCMKQGLHVLMEKPIACSLEDADALIEAASECGVILEIGQMYRFDKGVELLKRKLKNGEAGQLTGFQLVSAYVKTPDYFDPPYRRDRERGGGTLFINGIHDIDRLRYICGEIDSVAAHSSNLARGLDVEDTISVSIHCKSGLVGTLLVSDASHRLMPYTDFYYGTRASFMFNCSSMFVDDPQHVFQQVSWTGAITDQRIERYELTKEDNHLKQIHHFSKLIQGMESPKTTGGDGKKSLEVLLAIHQSVLTGQKVTIS